MVLQGIHRLKHEFFLCFLLSLRLACIYFYVIDFSVKEELFMIPREIANTLHIFFSL